MHREKIQLAMSREVWDKLIALLQDVAEEKKRAKDKLGPYPTVNAGRALEIMGELNIKRKHP